MMTCRGPKETCNLRLQPSRDRDPSNAKCQITRKRTMSCVPCGQCPLLKRKVSLTLAFGLSLHSREQAPRDIQVFGLEKGEVSASDLARPLAGKDPCPADMYSLQSMQRKCNLFYHKRLFTLCNANARRNANIFETHVRNQHGMAAISGVRNCA